MFDPRITQAPAGVARGVPNRRSALRESRTSHHVQRTDPQRAHPGDLRLPRPVARGNRAPDSHRVATVARDDLGAALLAVLGVAVGSLITSQVAGTVRVPIWSLVIEPITGCRGGLLPRCVIGPRLR